MSNLLSNQLHLYFELDDKMGQGFVRRAKALEAKLQAMERDYVYVRARLSLHKALEYGDMQLSAIGAEEEA